MVSTRIKQARWTAYLSFCSDRLTGKTDDRLLVWKDVGAVAAPCDLANESFEPIGAVQRWARDDDGMGGWGRRTTLNRTEKRLQDGPMQPRTSVSGGEKLRLR
jgi:hypothetical protein